MEKGVAKIFLPLLLACILSGLLSVQSSDAASACAHICIEHTHIGDLVVTVGVGDPSAPCWSKVVWNRQGDGKDNLDLCIDVSKAAASLPPSEMHKWYLKVYDAAGKDKGCIRVFTITCGGQTYHSWSVPVRVCDFQCSFAYIPSFSVFAHICIKHTYRGDLIVDIGAGTPACPVWSKRIWNGRGGAADNLDLWVDLSTAMALLPPGTVCKWWLKVYDQHKCDQGQIKEFTIHRLGRTYCSCDVPTPICDLKTSCAWIRL